MRRCGQRVWVRRIGLPLGSALLLLGCSHSKSSLIVAAPWTLVHSAPGESSVVVRYSLGDCDSLAGADVELSRASAHISVLVHRASGCDDAGRDAVARVDLGATLERRTVSGACRHDRPLCPPATTSLPIQHVRVVGPHSARRDR